MVDDVKIKFIIGTNSAKRGQEAHMAAAQLASGSTVVLARFVSVLDNELQKMGRPPARLNMQNIKFSSPKIEAAKGEKASRGFNWSGAIAEEEAESTSSKKKK